ncbi:MAG: phosphatidate cytidylyltransferase [Patulibacter sp.]|nr:phosphatidate cytidylyltransferase [Patulibacter sp.]
MARFRGRTPRGDEQDESGDDRPDEQPSRADGERVRGEQAPAPPRGRRREARFELEFGDFEPAERETTLTGQATGTGRRTGSVDRTGTGSRERSAFTERTGSGDRTGAGDRGRTTRGERSTGGAGDQPSPDPVADEIEALERFEDAIESVRSTSERSGSDLGARVLVAIPAAILAVFLVAQGGPIFVAAIAIFGAIGVWELSRMFAKARPSLVAGTIGVLALIVLAAVEGREAMLTALAAMIPIVFLSVALARPRGGMPGVAVTLLGITWIGIALGHAVLLRETDHGGGIVLNVLIGTFVGDTGAYLGGRMFGNRKLAPRISPNKTVEGLLIGMVTAVAAVWFAGLYQDWFSGTDALLLGLAVAVAAPLGDLFESFLKRDAGTKDAGGLFGVHGGVLDRLDAAMFAVVAGYYVWLAIGIA